MSSAKESSSETQQIRKARRKRLNGEADENFLSSLPVESFPTRDCSNLYACRETIQCALHQQCVPCAYKVGCFDVALDTHFCREVPNQRPEQCPRMREVKTQTFPNMGYRKGMALLTVGDGDFSFSLALARMLSSDNSRAEGQTIVATSYETKETLCSVYPNMHETLKQLSVLGVSVCFQVDATRLLETLLKHVTKVNGKQRKFHRIVWNFPCSAEPSGQDGQNQAMEHNKQLIREFVGKNAYQLLHQDGEIHMCHKTKPPYNQWRMEKVALQGFAEGPTPVFLGRVVLDRSLFPRNAEVKYTPRKALDRKSFPCHDACFYVFSFKSSPHADDSTPEEEQKFPRTIPLNHVEYDRNDDPVPILPVTGNLIQRIRCEHLSASTTKRQRKGKSKAAPKRRRR